VSTSAGTREGQTLGGASWWVRYANLVKLPHTVFALPFALTGVVLATRPADDVVLFVPLAHIGWVIVAFTAARFAAMAFNRIVDREIDARNPRTRDREIPRGVISVGAAWISVAVAALLFVYSAYRLNPLCFALSPVALAWVFLYSYTKRFTRWSHLVLGIGLSIAPVGGYLAITGHWSEPWWMLPALAIGVASWVAGFDVLYALADEEFDRAQGLHSLPAALGRGGAIRVSRMLHVASVLALAVAGMGASVGMLYWAGVAAVGALLLYEHRLVKADDLSKLDAAFFTMNGVISITFFAFVLADGLFS
jgi:4-hydroxybenzoate polyprenyltransferase